MQREQIIKFTLDQKIDYFDKFLNEHGYIPEDVLDLYQISKVLKMNDMDSINYINKIQDETGFIPKYLIDLYDIAMRAQQREQLAIQMKQLRSEWISIYPEYRNICNIMRNFETDLDLIEFRRIFPGESINERALSIYKKCISYRQKFTNKIQQNLTFTACTPTVFYEKALYCIDREVAYSLLNKYLTWRDKIHPYWKKVYDEYSLFEETSDFHIDYWNKIIKSSYQLSEKSKYITDIHNEVVRLLKIGSELISEIDSEAMEVYRQSKVEMSLYEYEAEVARLGNEDSINEESYCYVYVLECELCVFYVGLAADPRERLDQHIRGAFSHEAHLLKSKFIQKYQDSMKQYIVFEGTRRDCRKYEREYIAKHRPLGNMTDGGEG